jgi:hypothetical protein
MRLHAAPAHGPTNERPPQRGSAANAPRLCVAARRRPAAPRGRAPTCSPALAGTAPCALHACTIPLLCGGPLPPPPQPLASRLPAADPLRPSAAPARPRRALRPAGPHASRACTPPCPAARHCRTALLGLGKRLAARRCRRPPPPCQPRFEPMLKARPSLLSDLAVVAPATHPPPHDFQAAHLAPVGRRPAAPPIPSGQPQPEGGPSGRRWHICPRGGGPRLLAGPGRPPRSRVAPRARARTRTRTHAMMVTGNICVSTLWAAAPEPAAPSQAHGCPSPKPGPIPRRCAARSDGGAATAGLRPPLGWHTA